MRAADPSRRTEPAGPARSSASAAPVGEDDGRTPAGEGDSVGGQRRPPRRSGGRPAARVGDDRGCRRGGRPSTRGAGSRSPGLAEVEVVRRVARALLLACPRTSLDGRPPGARTAACDARPRSRRTPARREPFIVAPGDVDHRRHRWAATACRPPRSAPRRCSSAIPRATTPATVAATAATAGTVRVRCRAASRAAYLTVSGSRSDKPRDEGDDARAAPGGSSRGRTTIAPTAMKNSPTAGRRDAVRRQRDAGAEQAPTEHGRARRTVRRSPRRPARTATTSCRDAMPRRDHGGQQRAAAARRPRSPATVRPRHVERAEPAPREALDERQQRPARPAIAEHARRAARRTPPSTTPAGEHDAAGLDAACRRWRPSGPGSAPGGGRRRRTPARPAAPPRAAP